MFSKCRSPQEVKSLYRQLAFRYHPDRGGDNEMMKRVNEMYHAALRRFHGFTSRGSDGKEHTYHYSEKVEQAVMDKISELLRARLKGCQIEIIGTWIWVSGDTKPNREKLSQCKCRWHSKRQRWYWRPQAYRSRYNRNVSFDQLRLYYGSKVIDAESSNLPVKG